MRVILAQLQSEVSAGWAAGNEAKKRADAADRRRNQPRQSEPATPLERSADTNGTKGNKKGKPLKKINLDDNQSTLQL